MIWLLERGAERLVCEIRRNEDEEQPQYVFEVAADDAVRTYRYGSPSELITDFLHRHTLLCSEGWHPSAELPQRAPF
jgi:hypothetical protein